MAKNDDDVIVFQILLYLFARFRGGAAVSARMKAVSLLSAN